MCTVTLAPIRAGQRRAYAHDWESPSTLRLVCNRDERRSRPAALPPRIQNFGRRRALMPTDPVSGGSWIAANDAGLVLTLLNRFQSGLERPAPRRSRGLIIPTLLHASTLREASDLAACLLPQDYGPFRLLLTDRSRAMEVSSNCHCLTFTLHKNLGEPLLFTSSGLGDDLVDPPRRRLFADLLAMGRDRCDWQDRFHSHSWADLPHLSVCMRRSDAATVSSTIVELFSSKVIMIYRQGPPDQLDTAVSLDLRLVAEDHE